MKGWKGVRRALRLHSDMMDWVGWREGRYVDDVVCFLESWYIIIIISNKL